MKHDLPTPCNRNAPITVAVTGKLTVQDVVSGEDAVGHQYAAQLAEAQGSLRVDPCFLFLFFSAAAAVTAMPSLKPMNRVGEQLVLSNTKSCCRGTMHSTD